MRELKREIIGYHEQNYIANQQSYVKLGKHPHYLLRIANPVSEECEKLRSKNTKRALTKQIILKNLVFKSFNLGMAVYYMKLYIKNIWEELWSK